MKKLLIIFGLIASTASAQDTLKVKPALWKTLTVSHTFGVNQSSYAFNQSSINLFYEFKPNVAFTNWTGCQYPSALQPGWFSSQTLMTRRFDALLLGSGVQYNNPLQPVTTATGSWFFVVNASYRFKLD